MRDPGPGLTGPPDHCAECGFTYSSVQSGALQEAFATIASNFSEVLRQFPDDVLVRRPSPTTWSPLEYSAHVRDVFLNLRDRVVLAVVEDAPTFAPLHREERLQLGDYNAERPSDVAADLATASRLLGRVFARLDDDQLSRRGIYAGVEVDVLWIGRQAVHEGRHHLEDVMRALG